jgi:glycosyltransferase involved in cell wall biosynthesis|tara:strand:+ start:14345 stop:15481 length:1137 start_codon:yes stop_codon:yes gene_type:complete
MNITHVIIGLNIGGAELMLARLIETQRRTAPRLRHRVISLTSLGEIGQQLQAQGIEVTALGMSSAIRGPATLWQLTRLLRQERPDMVQTWMYHADLIGGIAAWMAGIRAIIWGIRTTDITKGGSRVTRAIRWLCARLSRHIPMRIVCAADVSLRKHSDVGYDSARMLVIPNGIAIERMTATPEAVVALRREYGLTPSNRVVGMVGRFNTVKGQEDFVASTRRIASACPEARFMMVGLGCDLQNPQFKVLITQSAAADRFVLMGKRTDVPVCLAAMDVFVLPSRTEGFPNVLAEAMAMARPCVATDVGDARKVLGDSGFVVPPEKPDALANAVLAMLNASDEMRAAYGASAQHRVETEYTMVRSAQGFEALYDSVANSK